jgi:hypothetical protein
LSAVQTTGAKLAPETAEAHASTVIKYEKITLERFSIILVHSHMI